MNGFAELWRGFAQRYPKTYVLGSCLVLFAAGTMSGLGVGAASVLTLAVGYTVNIVWLLRQER